MKRRNSIFRRRREGLQFRQMGAKLDSEEDLSPDSSPPKGRDSASPLPSSTTDLGDSTPLPPPPPSRPPFLGKTRRPKGPPAPDDPYWLVERRRRLPSYYYRRLPDYFYLPESEAQPTEACTHAAQPSAVGNVAAGRSLAAEAARVKDAEIEAVEESHEE